MYLKVTEFWSAHSLAGEKVVSECLCYQVDQGSHTVRNAQIIIKQVIICETLSDLVSRGKKVDSHNIFSRKKKILNINKDIDGSLKKCFTQ